MSLSGLLCMTMFDLRLLADAANRFHLTVSDIINYNHIASPTISYVFIKKVHSTDINTVKIF